MPRGGKRKGSGRKAGEPSRRFVKFEELKKVATMARLSPLQYLVAVYNDPNETDARKMQAAIAAAPFLHCRLAALTVNNPTRVDENGIPIIDIGSNGGQGGPAVTTINILPVASGTYLDDEKASDIIEAEAAVINE